MEEFFKLWPREARWFIIAGMADTDEAQQVKQRFPDVKCIGIEPNPVYIGEQAAMDFPGQLVYCALWKEKGRGMLTRPFGATWASASICRPNPAPDTCCSEWTAEEQHEVELRTLDSIHDERGPFDEAVLWLDVEYAEVEALRGAERLLREGRILMVNVETYAFMNLPAVVDLLYGYGLTLRKVWNTRGVMDAQDYVFMREDV